MEQCGDICFNKQNWRSSGMTQSPVECVPLHSESLISSLPMKVLLGRGGKCYYVIRLASFYCVFPLSQSTFTAELQCSENAYITRSRLRVESQMVNGQRHLDTVTSATTASKLERGTVKTQTQRGSHGWKAWPRRGMSFSRVGR